MRAAPKFSKACLSSFFGSAGTSGGDVQCSTVPYSSTPLSKRKRKVGTYEGIVNVEGDEIKIKNIPSTHLVMHKSHFARVDKKSKTLTTVKKNFETKVISPVPQLMDKDPEDDKYVLKKRMKDVL